MPQYRIIWNNDEAQRGYSVANSILELAQSITKNEAFRGEVTSIVQSNPHPRPVR